MNDRIRINGVLYEAIRNSIVYGSVEELGNPGRIITHRTVDHNDFRSSLFIKKEMNCGPIKIAYDETTEVPNPYESNDRVSRWHNVRFMIDHEFYRELTTDLDCATLVRSFRKFLKTSIEFPATAEEIVDQFIDEYL